MPKLKEYIDKRNFTQTKEPVGGKVAGNQLAFVVQRHHATRLHYDFRLQMNGVLKSWAVPKGPSLNPLDKRLAMMVEDHPLDYKDFEGEIPKGNYGAGNVLIWDEGYYVPMADYKDPEKGLLKELKSGSLKIILMGKRLKGEFALVKIKSDEENSWLLIKHRDKYAVDKEYNSEDYVSLKEKDKKNITSDRTTASKKKPVRTHTTIKPIVPMLTTLGNEMVKGEDWLFEPKLDGYRIVGITDGYHNCKLFTRNQLDYTTKYKNIADILKTLDRACVLDGEIVKLNDEGKPSFNALQLFGKNPVGKVHYYVFDLLQLDEHSLVEMPLVDRKKILEALVKSIDSPYIIFTPYEFGNGDKLLEEARKSNSEGIMAKKAESIYHPGYRTKEWIKLKVNQEDEFIIGGYTEPRGKKGLIGAFLLGDNKNGKLAFSGKCGTGLDELRDQEIYAALKNYETTQSPFSEKITNDTKIHWLKPELVCTVKYSERTEDGKLRHPVFKALREDKTVADMKPAEDNTEMKVNGSKVSVTNRNKIYFPDNITKGDVIDYYDTISDYILPYLKNRPLSLHRHPNGINAPSFFQKDIENKSYSWLKTVSIHSESNDKDIDYLVCNDKKTLIYMANLGCIEINPWLSRYPGIEKPDFLVLDLDPEDIGFSSVIEVALVIKELLDSLKITSYPKTSGSTGIHIYIHTGAKYHYDSVKLFAEWLAGQAHDQIPAVSSIERSPQKRQKKVYIDFLQNRKGQTVAAPYSLRPKPGATVSWPLSWDQINKDLKMEDYTIHNVPDLLAKGINPWEDIYSSVVNIAAIMKKLQV